MVSVIIPTYNRSKSVSKSIYSVLHQTYQDFEVIVVDDGSTDDTRTTIEKYNDKRIHYYYQENSGANVARNTGINYSKGNYIAFLDSDAVWIEKKLEIQLDKLINANADFIFSKFKRINKNNVTILPANFESIDDLCLDRILYKNFCDTSTILLKRNIACELLFDTNLKRFQDWDFFIRIVLGNYKVEFINEPLADTYIANDNITLNVDLEKAHIDIVNKYRDLYLSHTKALHKVYMYIARNYRQIDRKVSEKYLYECLRIDSNIKTYAKIFLNKLKMWN